MKATIERVRECKKEGGGYLISCKDKWIFSKRRFKNGEFAILIEEETPKIEKIKKIFDLDEETQNFDFSIGDDVTQLFKCNL